MQTKDTKEFDKLVDAVADLLDYNEKDDNFLCERIIEAAKTLSQSLTVKGEGETGWTLEKEIEFKNNMRAAGNILGRGEQRAEGWVRVEDGLPDYDVPSLWIQEDGNMFVTMLDKDGNDWLYEGVIEGNKITHWMPLPSPPNSSTTD